MSLYAVVCILAIYAATKEYEQQQPIGLLIVGMVFIPIIITIYGGLPLDFMKKTKPIITTMDHKDLT
jgi:hypothetical protein